MLILTVYILLCVFLGILASRYNRSSLGYFLLATIITPVLTLLLLLCLGSAEAKDAKESLAYKVNEAVAVAIKEQSKTK